eukprot:911419-Rhodomonas_salina.1
MFPESQNVSSFAVHKTVPQGTRVPGVPGTRLQFVQGPHRGQNGKMKMCAIPACFSPFYPGTWLRYGYPGSQSSYP